MTATTAMVDRVRRLTNEPSQSSSYSDDSLSTIIGTYPLVDVRGEEPFTWDTSTEPPTQDANENWIVTYDINAAAADVWEEKASTLPQDFDYQADGGSYSRSQVYEQHMKQARYFRSKRSAKTIRQEPWPPNTTDEGLSFNVNNPRS